MPPSTTAERTLPALTLRDRTLPNGLRVVSFEDHRSASVAVAVGYRVGGKDDPPGRSGFAHLFEHLMFKGTKTAGAETIDRLTEDVGGYNNAYTADDLTNYYEVVPSNHLERILWAEADRMAGLIVDEASFHTERDVVISEFDQRILAEPYGMLRELTERNAYAVHPYRRGVIGNPDELRAATLDDVLAFHHTYYRPDNAVLVVAGDFEPAALDAWVDRYFGAIPAPAGTIPRIPPDEPVQTAERRLQWDAPSAPLPAVEIAYHIGDARDPDAPVLDVIETILGMGRSSRLYRSLVYDKQLATSAYCIADLREGPGLFILRAVASAGKAIRDVEMAFEAELERLRTEPVGDDELEKVRTQIFSVMVRGRQTYNDIAQQLVRAAIVRHDPRAVDRDVDALFTVTPEDILRVAQRVFTPENRTVVVYEKGANA